MEEGGHTAIVPSKRLVTNAKRKGEPKSSRKGEPSFFMSESMKRSVSYTHLTLPTKA